jgi:uncharacterized protein YycO
MGLFLPGRVLAETATASFWSRLTSRFTRSKWTHVALIIDEHTLIESIFPHGVREYPLAERLKELEGREWALMDLPTNPGTAVIDAARKYAGRRYDFLQCVILGVLGRFIQDGPLRVICSRLVTSAYWDQGIPLFVGARPEGVTVSRWEGMLKGFCTPGDLVTASQLQMVHYVLPAP